MKNFWQELPKPIFALAPMADVTDAAFRRIIAKYSNSFGPAQDLRPAVFVMYTEFVSADGLCLANEDGRAKLMRDLAFSEAERPIVAQFFTSKPEYMERAAALAQKLGFDGVDINMGCPAGPVNNQGAGAELILKPKVAQELIAAAKRGAPNLPVSVKTRLGYNKDILEDWLPMLLEAKPAAVIIHARTRKEMSKVPARWERVARAVAIRNGLKSDTLIIGNGDLKDLKGAEEKIKETGADGAMLGRAIFGRPWLFSETETSLKGSESAVERDGAKHSKFLAKNLRCPEDFVSVKLQILVEHTKLFEKLLGDVKSFVIMKKHFKAYCEGFPGAKELRMKLMEAETAEEVEQIIKEGYSRG